MIARMRETSQALSEAQRYLLDFPEAIPGAKKIEKFPARSPQHCLVHIKQYHIITPDFFMERDMKSYEVMRRFYGEAFKWAYDKTNKKRYAEIKPRCGRN